MSAVTMTPHAKWPWACLLVGLLAGPFVAADTLSLAIDAGGAVTARNGQGTTLWSIRNPMGGGLRQVSKDEQGRIWLDGSLRVDHLGRILSVDGEGWSALSEPTAEAALAFDTPVEISLGDPYDYTVGQPLIDSDGDAWVIIRGDDLDGFPDLHVLLLARYDRASASWLPTEILYSTTRSRFSYPPR